MSVTLPIDIYEVFEGSFGKEGAHKVVKSLESVISHATDYKWNATKDELLDAIRKEFITRELFEERLNVIDGRFNAIDEKFKNIRIEMDERFNVVDEKFNNIRIEMNERFNVVDEKFTNIRTEINEKFNVVDERFNGVDKRFNVIDEKLKSLNFKLNIFIAIALLALTLANPTFVKLVEKIFKI